MSILSLFQRTKRGAEVEVLGRKAVVVKGLTPLEAILHANNSKMPIAGHGFNNKLLVEEDDEGDFELVPPKVVLAMPLLEGIGFAVGEKGKPFGKEIVVPFMHGKKEKSAIYRVGQEHQPLVDHIILSEEYNFQADAPTIQLLNAATGKPITDLGEASEIIVQFNGKLATLKIENRVACRFKELDGGMTNVLISDTPAVGLIWRSLIQFEFVMDCPSFASLRKQVAAVGRYRSSEDGEKQVYTSYLGDDGFGAIFFEQAGQA